jgi:hypothetical protein
MHVLLVALLLTLLAPLAAAEEVVVTSDRAVLRAGPSLGSKEMRKAAKGERLEVESLEGDWLKVKTKPPAYIGKSQVRVVKTVPAPAANIEGEDAFFDWVGERGDVAEVTVREPGVIWVVLARDLYAAPPKLREAAKAIACGYGRLTGFKREATVTVWPETGAGDRYIARETCR